MAYKIKLLRASSLDDLERTINEFFNEAAEDARYVVTLAGGVSYAEGEYITIAHISAAHRRTFDEDDKS